MSAFFGQCKVWAIFLSYLEIELNVMSDRRCDCSPSAVTTHSYQAAFTHT